MRKLIDGTVVNELESPVTLTVYTKCPRKWILVDQETGVGYEGYETDGKNSWRYLGMVQVVIADAKNEG
jgi:hypothetical protein